MIPFKVDVSEFAQKFAITEQDVKTFTDNIVSEVAYTFENNLIQIAGRDLTTSRDEYQKSIYSNKVTDGVYEVGLNGFVANSVEQGITSFDQKEGFKNSSKRHETKDGGWYLTIPFKWKKSGGVESGSQVFSNMMPPEVTKVAEKLGNKQQIQKHQIPNSVSEPKQKIPKSRLYEQYQRKHSVYEGITKTKDSSGRGGYTSFRRVSNNSDESAWIHPGIEQRGLFQKALATIQSQDVLSSIVRRQVNQLVQ
jgi:hypothetical protein